jgi:hypothetical protein
LPARADEVIQMRQTAFCDQCICWQKVRFKQRVIDREFVPGAGRDAVDAVKAARPDEVVSVAGAIQ